MFALLTPRPSVFPPLAKSSFMEGRRRTFCTEEFAGNVESLASDNNDLLAIEQLLGYSAGQATQEMPLAIDHDL